MQGRHDHGAARRARDTVLHAIEARRFKAAP
jgi:hypothetical protein